MRAAQLGVSMGDAVMAWLHEASVPGPLVTAQVAVTPLVMDVDELRAAVVGVPARPATTSEPVSGALAELRAKAFTGPFSKAAQMGKK